MIRRLFLAIVLVGAIATAWGGAPRSVSGESLKLGSPAPDVVGGPWIGSAPLTVASLRGRVALIEFWTFG